MGRGVTEGGYVCDCSCVNIGLVHSWVCVGMLIEKIFSERK